MKTHACGECGYQWVHGQDGSHSCSKYLKIKISALEAALEKQSKENLILREGLNKMELTFEQKVIEASRNIPDAPLKDFLDDHEIERAIQILSDIYTVIGVTMPTEEEMEADQQKYVKVLQLLISKAHLHENIDINKEDGDLLDEALREFPSYGYGSSDLDGLREWHSR